MLRFGFGMIPVCSVVGVHKSQHDKAQEIPSTDLLVRRILGENHNCRVIYLEKEEGRIPARATGSVLFGYPVIHMTKDDFLSEEGVKAHELCHIKNNDLVMKYLIYGVTAVSLNAVLQRKMLPSQSYVLRFGKMIARWGCSAIVAEIASFSYEKAWAKEKRADLMGFSFCSKEGQVKMIQHFQDEMEKRQSYLRWQIKAVEEMLQEHQEDFGKWKAQYPHRDEKFYRPSDGCLTVDQVEVKAKDLIALKKDILLVGSSSVHPPFSERIEYLKDEYRKTHGEDVSMSIQS